MGKRLTTEQFIQKAREIHDDKYDYSKVKYINSETKVCVTCPEHGDFWISPSMHIYDKNGCRECRKEQLHNKFKKTTEEFIKQAREIHGDKYDYSKVEYVNAKTKVCIICPEHGEFYQQPNSHLQGRGCPECGNNKRGCSLTTEEFIKRAKEIHGDKYDYSKVEYINNRTKVCIICPEHGEFWQKPDYHIYSKTGCQMCSESHLEKKVRNFLIENSVNFETQKTFKWLKYKTNLYLDFYLPEYNIAIECQGIQHFKPISFGSKKNEKEKKEIFKLVKKRDNIKKKLCEKNGIKLYYFTNVNYFFDKTIYSNETLFKNINFLKKVCNL